MTAFSAASVAGVPAGIHLAAWQGWRAPFLVVGGLAVVVGAVAFFAVPSLRSHLRAGDGPPTRARDLFRGVLHDRNQLPRARLLDRPHARALHGHPLHRHLPPSSTSG